jgi:serine phosphatase RsbU (regulator of sigma subunit)
MNIHLKLISLRSALILVVLLISNHLFAQTPQVDSLKLILKDLKADTTKVIMLNEIAASLIGVDADEAIKYGTEAKDLAEKINYPRGLAVAYKNIGVGHYFKDEFKEALQNWVPSLNIFEELGDEKLMANILSNVGVTFFNSGVYDQALENYLQALKLAEKVGDSLRIATLDLNIGLVYAEQPSKLEYAKNYYLRAIKLAESIDYTDLMGLGSLNLGEAYFKLANYDSAIYFFEKSIVLVSNEVYVAGSLNYIGQIYAEKGDYETAIKYQQDALEMALKDEKQLVIPQIYIAMASTYSKQGKFSMALDYYMKAKSQAEEFDFKKELSEAFKGLADTYAAMGDYANAYNYMYLQDTLDNAIYRLETESNTAELMFSYQMEKKEDEISVLEHNAEIEQLKARRQRIVILSIGLFGLLVLMAAVGLYNRMRFIRETNRKIEAQKNEIESQRDEIEKTRDKIQLQHDLVYSQKEMITDSISYAQRIQSALLPSAEQLNELVPEHFVVFKPKDIVSGDYYWVKEVLDHVVIVGADCTGHGVPGAFMSMLGMTLLNDLISDRCFNAPSAILEQMRLKIKGLLVQNGGSEEQKDGMDMALAIFNKNNRELHFAGANNPVYIIRDKNIPGGKELEPYISTEGEDYQLYEIKGDKQPMGVHWEETSFRTHSIMLREDDTFYIFSDGIVDQYGGPNRKKYKSLNFKRLLLSIQRESMQRQGQIVENTFETWKGDIEQIDDVSVIGVKI